MKKIHIIRRLFRNNLFLKLFSLGAALLFWFVVVINVSPESVRTIVGVPIVVDESANLLSAADLHVIEKSDSKVSVRLSGPRYAIGRLTSGDFIVKPDISPVSKSGTYQLKLNVALKNPDHRVNITKISPEEISINFDTIISKSFPVEIRIKQNKIAEGYIQEEATANPGRVVATGPSSEVLQISSAVVNVSVGNLAQKTITTKEDVELLDAKNKKLDLEHVTLDNKIVVVTVPILKTKVVPLNVNFLNIPAGFSKDNLKISIDPANVLIAGSALDVDEISQVMLENIDFNSLELNNTLRVPILPINGIISIDNINTANVSIQLLNTAEKDVSTNTFEIINPPQGFTVKVQTALLSGIRLFGPASEIGSVQTVTAKIDMANFPKVEGQYEVPVSITVPGKTGFWVNEIYKVAISLVKN